MNSNTVVLETADLAGRESVVIEARGKDELIFLKADVASPGKTIRIKYNLHPHATARVFTKITEGVSLQYEAELAQGAEIRFYGLTQTKSGADAKIDVTVRHREGQNYSEQKFYSYADDDSRVSFTGRITVDPGASGAVAHQLHRGVLLSENARINADPFLNIMHDDVRCTHGSTIGFIDQDAMRYLMARGLDPERAEQMLIFSSQREFYSALPDEAARTYFSDGGDL